MKPESRKIGEVKEQPQLAEIPDIIEQEKVCPICGTENEEQAIFCENCGQSLTAGDHCPKCRATTLPGADICEVCGAWLLQGKYCFCYAPL